MLCVKELLMLGLLAAHPLCRIFLEVLIFKMIVQRYTQLKFHFLINFQASMVSLGYKFGGKFKSTFKSSKISINWKNVLKSRFVTDVFIVLNNK